MLKYNKPSSEEICEGVLECICKSLSECTWEVVSCCSKYKGGTIYGSVYRFLSSCDVVAGDSKYI